MKNLLPLVLISFASGLVGSSTARADNSQRTLTPPELFYRCYSHLTQKPISSKDSRIVALAQPGQTIANAVTACMTLLRSANLNATTHLASNTPETLSILRTMDEAHRSIFSNDNLANSVPGGDDFPSGRMSTDETEPALHLDYILFGGGNYSDLVVSPSAMEALRDSGPIIPYVGGGTPNYFTTPMGVQQGNLLGVQPMVLGNPKLSFSISLPGSQNGSAFPTMYMTQYPSSSNTAEVGGGILGSMTYMEENFGRDLAQLMDGGVYQPRRWAQSLLHDVLCRNLPPLRATDPVAMGLVEPSPGPATPPFRPVASCMQCHGGIDSIAATARGYEYYWPGSVNNGVSDYSIHMVLWPVTQSGEGSSPYKKYQDNDGFPWVDSDPYFYERPPIGVLRYRSYDGTLVDTSVLGLVGLGQAVSQTNDLYVCAAAHYFRFFTGINVNLQDIGDPANPVLSNAEMDYRNQVIALGLALKANQSVPTLIQSILSSPLYTKQSMRDEGP